MFKYIDTHSHMHDKKYLSPVVDRLKELASKGVATIVVGTDLGTSREICGFVGLHNNVWASIGVHPVDDKNAVFDEEEFESLLRSTDKIVAVGECGLDYYYFDEVLKSDALLLSLEKERQKALFITQIKFAIKNCLPLMLHGRPQKGSMDAYEDMLDILEGEFREVGSRLRGNAHFFVGGLGIARRFVAIGFTISFSGVITFAREYDEVIRSLPMSSILAETDSPNASPLPFRGKTNSPLYVNNIYEKIAEIRGQDAENVRINLNDNATRVFGLTR